MARKLAIYPGFPLHRVPVIEDAIWYRHIIPSAFQITNCRRIDAALGESAQLARKIDQNPAVAAEEKRQLIDTVYGAMTTLAHAGTDAFAAINKALGK